MAMSIQELNRSNSGLASQVTEMLRGMRVVDLSPTLERGIPNWPMHPRLVIDKAREVERDGYYCQLLMISEHAGTHVDAPTHFHPSMTDMSIDRFPADKLIAPPVLYDFSSKQLTRIMQRIEPHATQSAAFA